MERRSFYILDYIIQINEQRLEQYTRVHQKVLEKLTHIILIYSAIAIFLIPLIQDGIWFKIKNLFFSISLIVFLILFVISLIFTVKLILPGDVFYLDFPKKYYEDFRLQYELKEKDPVKVENLLKGPYIEELEKALLKSETACSLKSSFYYNALVYGLLAVAPYLVCLAFHVSYKENIVQQVQIVNAK
ncbi:MAG TPA: hypothetical protein VK622_11135 [Puia sp.]|nr:hypothetical protein [Puia sp.]